MQRIALSGTPCLLIDGAAVACTIKSLLNCASFAQIALDDFLCLSNSYASTLFTAWSMKRRLFLLPNSSAAIV